MLYGITHNNTKKKCKVTILKFKDCLIQINTLHFLQEYALSLAVLRPKKRLLFVNAPVDECDQRLQGLERLYGCGL